MSERRMKFQSLILANWDKVPVVEGRIVDKGVEDIEGRKVDYITVDTQDGHVKVFRSEALGEAFDASIVGDFCKLEYLDTVLTAQKRPFRRFRSQVWDDPSAPVLAPVLPQSGRRAARSARK